jgi:hypothetical protein
VGDIGPGIRALGQALGQAGETLYIDEANEQFDDARMNTLLGWQETKRNIFGQSVNEDGSIKPTPSLEGIGGSVQGFNDSLEQYAPKNGTARRHWQAWVKSRQPQWKAESVAAMLAKRQIDAQAAILKYKANVLKVEDTLEADVAIADIKDTSIRNGMDKELAEIESRALRHEWEMARLKQFAQNNPSGFKEMLTVHPLLEDTEFREITTDDLISLVRDAEQAESILNFEAEKEHETATRNISRGIHTAQTPQEVMAIKDQIVNNPIFTGEDIDRWADEADRKIAKMTSGKEYSPEETSVASKEYHDLMRVKEYDKAMKSVMKNSSMFTTEKTDSRIGKIYEAMDNPGEVTKAHPAVEQGLDSIESLRSQALQLADKLVPTPAKFAKLTDEEKKEQTKLSLAKTAEIEADYNARANELIEMGEQWRDDGLTDEEIQKRTDAFLRPAIEVVAKESVNRWWRKLLPRFRPPRFEPVPDEPFTPIKPFNQEHFEATLRGMSRQDRTAYYEKWKHLWPGEYE